MKSAKNLDHDKAIVMVTYEYFIGYLKKKNRLSELGTVSSGSYNRDSTVTIHSCKTRVITALLHNCISILCRLH